MHDQLTWGRRFRVLTIIDDVTKECLAAIPDTSLSGKRVVRELEAVITRRGKPGVIVSDNGTEFTSAAVLGFVQANKLRLALHRARQADPECLRRELPRADARQMSQRASLLLDDPRPCRDRRLDRGLQHRAAALGDRLHDAGCLRRRTEIATGTGSELP